MNYILESNRSQARIECFEDYIDADNEVRVIDKITDVLDIQSLGFKTGNNDIVGRPMFDPKDMLKLFVYGYFNGIRSSRKLAKQAIINKEIIWLINGIQPKYRVITRKDNEDFVDIVNKRTKENKAKYSQRQEIIEHVFGTVKRNMNFTYLLLRGFKKVIGEVSIAFFSYNLKRVINILGIDKLLRYLAIIKLQK